MSPDPNKYKFQMAIQDFQSARQKAGIQEILARITGKSTQLLSYDEVAEKLKLRARTERGVQHIPIDAIVGSIGRNTDFTRTFLPRRAGDQQRWANVKTAFLKKAQGYLRSKYIKWVMFILWWMATIVSRSHDRKSSEPSRHASLNSIQK